MEELISTFQIDVKLIIAQIINFGIVVFVLYKFAYRPLLKHMDERTKTIDQGLKDAKKATQRLEKAEEERENKLIEAKKEARRILEEAQTQSEKNKQEMVIKAKGETATIVKQAKQQIQSEKEKAIKEARGEIGDLVVMATEKVLNQKIDKEGDREIIAKAIEKIK